MFEFGIVVSASFVLLYQISIFFFRYQVKSFRLDSVAIFECHSFASNFNFLTWMLTNWSRRRAYADENVS